MEEPPWKLARACPVPRACLGSWRNLVVFSSLLNGNGTFVPQPNFEGYLGFLSSNPPASNVAIDPSQQKDARRFKALAEVQVAFDTTLELRGLFAGEGLHPYANVSV